MAESRCRFIFVVFLCGYLCSESVSGPFLGTVLSLKRTDLACCSQVNGFISSGPRMNVFVDNGVFFSGKERM